MIKPRTGTDCRGDMIQGGRKGAPARRKFSSLILPRKNLFAAHIFRSRGLSRTVWCQASPLSCTDIHRRNRLAIFSLLTAFSTVNRDSRCPSGRVLARISPNFALGRPVLRYHVINPFRCIILRLVMGLGQSYMRCRRRTK
jgi:hypothetical protein